jgi:hypothetical protein
MLIGGAMSGRSKAKAKKKMNTKTAFTAIAGTQPKLAVLAVSGGIWQCSPVSEVAEVCLEDWDVYEVKVPGRENRTRHFVGTKVDRGRSGRVSSPIVSFDSTARRGVTESGRVYELVGQRTGLGLDAEYTWNNWQQINHVTDVVNVTEEIKASLAGGEAK